MNQKLKEIIAAKKIEVSCLYDSLSLEHLEKDVAPVAFNVYEYLRGKVEREKHFFISEFKRKSPSEGDINQLVVLDEQLDLYIQGGTTVVSVLTDKPYFGGSYNDLTKAAALLKGTGVLLLQKDFILDPIQIYLARKMGAEMILLIARILSTERLVQLKQVAESLGMAVLMELHDEAEYLKVKNLDCQLIGINNRDLDSFCTYVNRFNIVSELVPKNSLLVAESGIGSELDAAVVKSKADGFLIGTSLMRSGIKKSLKQHFDLDKAYFFKACGLRTFEDFSAVGADLIGVNFSPKSKRVIAKEVLNKAVLGNNAVAVFKSNSRETILQVMEKYPFKYAQIYVEDINDPHFLNSIKAKIILCGSVTNRCDIERLIDYAAFADLFILDGPNPGSGESVANSLFKNFPYPFLKAGGLNINNINKILELPNCIGVDIASGIESEGSIDYNKIKAIEAEVSHLNTQLTC